MPNENCFTILAKVNLNPTRQGRETVISHFLDEISLTFTITIQKDLFQQTFGILKVNRNRDLSMIPAAVIMAII